MSAVTSGEFVPEESKTLPPGLQLQPQLEVRAGDVLLARSNGVAELVGVTVPVDETRKQLMLSDKVLRLKPAQDRLSNAFLALTMKAQRTRQQIGQMINGSSGQRNISQADIRQLQIGLPSSLEQQRAAAVVRSLSVQERNEAKYLDRLLCLKSGLMQDLLTGKVRVKVDEVAAAGHGVGTDGAARDSP